MNLSPFTKYFFGKTETHDAKNPIDEVINYVKNIIVREDLVINTLMRYNDPQNLTSQNRVNSAIQTYFDLEQIIINNKPLIVQRSYTKTELREEIRKKFNLTDLPEAFRLIFTDEKLQQLLLFQIYTQVLAQYVANQTGSSRLEIIIASVSTTPPFTAIRGSVVGIDFTPLANSLQSVSQEDLISYFQKLNAALFSEITSSFGLKTAIDLTQKNYAVVKTNYDYDLISLYLKAVPIEVLEKERVAYMTRQDLEKQATDAVEERLRRELAEKSAKDLQITVEQLQRSKETVTRLLDESQKLEQDLRAERDRIKAIISSMNEGLFVVDKDGNITLVNESALKRINKKIDELYQKSIFDIFPIRQNDKQLTRDEHPLMITLHTGKAIIADIEDNYFYSTSEGMRFPVMISTAPLFDAETLSGATFVFRDITETLKYEETLREEKKIIEQKVAEQTQIIVKEKEELKTAAAKVHENYLQAQTNEAKLLASIKSLPLGFILTDTEDTIVAINETAKNILKATDEMKRIEDIENKITQAKTFKTQIAECKESKKSLELKEMSFENKILHCVITPIFLAEANSAYIGTVLLIEDVTEAKLLERTRDEFFAIASHELRTPLTAIQGYLSLINEFYQKSITDPEIIKIIGYIDQSTIHLIEIVNDFLSVSRLEQGKIEFVIKPLDIKELLTEVIHEVGNLAEKKQIYLHFDATPSIPLVHADREKTKQIIANLLGNAIKFTNQGGITITLETKDNVVFLKVKDTGKGVPLENQKLLFRKFQQAENNLLTRDINNGTGLGLYISKKFAENMNGSLYLESSEENKGSVFVLSFPSS